MNRIFIFLVLFILIFPNIQYPQSNHPKRELRAAWIATVVNLDWPSSPDLTTDQQEKELVSILDKLKETGINVVIFQVKSECDAMYPSTIEPWSYWLTGQQGKAPSPFYDPLEFAIEEAHKRGMELHAWVNPYRAVRSAGNYTISSQHVSQMHPDWILQFGSLKILDPGLPMVRDYVVSVIMDIVKRYDVDGIHFDDYFYPYEGITNEDDATFTNYSRGFTNRSDWRRDNVNIFVKQVYDSIQAVKSYVKFGISPFGIWKNGVPAGITGLDAYSVLYADPIAWLHQHIIDYLTPQLYWKFGGSQDYGKLMPWWADSAGIYNRHLYPGLAAYHIGDAQNWPASELLNQIRANRSNSNSQGSVFFRTLAGLLDNEKGFTDSLKYDLFKYPALLPIMSWKDTVKPNPPLNLEFGRIASTGRAGLKWDLPIIAVDGDSAKRYVIYHVNTLTPQQSDYEKTENILSIEGEKESFISSPNITAPYYFSVTALDRNYNESFPSNIVEVTAPASSLLSMPLNNEINIADTVELKWFYSDRASIYLLQVGTDSTFNSNMLINSDNITDTVHLVYGMEGQTAYFWRVKASNIVGESNFSQTYNFTTGFPVTPVLLFPADSSLDVSVNPLLSWNKSLTAESYRLQLSHSTSFNNQLLLIDSSGIIDTSINIENLNPIAYYFWRIAAENQYGLSKWSSVYRFKTREVLSVENEKEIPTEYSLSQNFPNPFNPSTTIRYSLPEACFVSLKVYNVLGQEVEILVNEYKNKGIYEVTFPAVNETVKNLPSNIYIYRIVTEKYSASRKMILLK